MPTLPLNLKLIAAGIVVALVAIAAGVIWYQHREVGNLNKKNGADQVVIADQQQAGSEAHATINNQLISGM